MSLIDLVNFKKYNKIKVHKLLINYNKILSNFSATERIKWALSNLFSNFVLTSSFGAQSAVSLHLITQQKPNIPVILIDTGYLFPETYNFIDLLHSKLNLNLHVVRAEISNSWQKTRYGKLWNMGVEGIDLYNKINKIQPMIKFFKNFSVKTWFAGLRFNQSNVRSKLSFLSIQKKFLKFLPILDWDNRFIHNYLKKYNLPYHPLWKNGYISIGDKHTTSKHIVGNLESKTRFFGLKRECGLHEF